MLRVLSLFSLLVRNDDVAPISNCALAASAAVDAAMIKVIVEPVAEELVTYVRGPQQFKLATRLRYVAKVQRWKNGKKPKPAGKARANLKPKPKPVVVGKVAKKRGPSLFPVKMKPVAPKKPTTRIYIEQKPKRTAEIVFFPVRKPKLGAPRLRRAA